jgi:hypothetical protein
VRVQGVVLEDHRDVAVFRRDIRHIALTDEDVAVVDLFEAGEHAQGGGFSAAGRADQNEEFAIGDLEVEVVDCGAGGTRVEAGCLVKGDGSHYSYSPSPAGTCRTIRCEWDCRSRPREAGSQPLQYCMGRWMSAV